MPEIFAAMAAEYGELGASLARRPVRFHDSDPSILDSGNLVMADAPAQVFEVLVAYWPDRVTAFGISDMVHELELEAAAQPPVFNVVVTPPDGMAVPGHFRVDTGSPDEQVTFITGPPPILPTDIPGRLGRRRFIRATRKLRNQFR